MKETNQAIALLVILGEKHILVNLEGIKMRTKEYNLEMQTRNSLRTFAENYLIFTTTHARRLNDKLAYALVEEVHQGEDSKIKGLKEFYESLKNDEHIARNFMRVVR